LETGYRYFYSVHAVEDGVRVLARRAEGMVARKAALRHDLLGRIFHRLLLEAKYLPTYYTSIPAATMLLRTALNPEKWAIDWSDLKQVAEFRVADLACGTGTLLMAAAEAISDNAIRTFASNELSISNWGHLDNRASVAQAPRDFSPLRWCGKGVESEVLLGSTFFLAT
jgi:hypothetical protein